MRNILIAFAVFLLPAMPLTACAEQNHAEIIEAVTAFVRAQTNNLPGQVAIKVDPIDQRIVRSDCPTLEPFLPPGSQLLGNSIVGVHCPGVSEWTLFVPVHIKVSVDTLIANKPLSQGHVLVAEDISSQKTELGAGGILTNPAEVIGKVLKNGVSAGQVLKQDMLRAPFVVIQGQSVQLRVEGDGFSVRSEGQVLGNAAEGQDVKVKTHSGQVIRGTARQGGIVEIHQ